MKRSMTESRYVVVAERSGYGGAVGDRMKRVKKQLGAVDKTREDRARRN